jgi:hypothetical protein
MGYLIALTLLSSAAAWAATSTINEGTKSSFNAGAWTIATILMASPFWLVFLLVGGE